MLDITLSLIDEDGYVLWLQENPTPENFFIFVSYFFFFFLLLSLVLGCAWVVGNVIYIVLSFMAWNTFSWY